MKIQRYDLNPNTIFIFYNGRKIAIQEFDRQNPFYREIYDVAIANLKPGQIGTFEIVFVRADNE